MESPLWSVDSGAAGLRPFVFPGRSSSCIPNPSVKGRMGILLLQKAGVDRGDTGSDSVPSWGAARLWEVVITGTTTSARGAPEMDLVGRRLCQDVNSSPELSTQVVNPSWGRFRFYSLSHFLEAAGRAHRSVRLLGMALAMPWQLLACLGEGQRRMHITGTSTSSLSPQQFFTVVAEQILICVKLYEREMYSKETHKIVAIGGYCYLLSTVSMLLGQWCSKGPVLCPSLLAKKAPPSWIWLEWFINQKRDAAFVPSPTRNLPGLHLHFLSDTPL